MPSFGAAPASGGSTFTSCFANSTDQIYGASPSASRTGSGLLDGPLRQLLSASAHLDADLAAAQKTAQDFNRRHSSIQRGLVTCLSRSQSMQQEESIERDLAQATQWNVFDIIEFAKRTEGRTLQLLTLFFLDNFDLFERLGLQRANAERFLAAIEAAYLPNPYHNAVHAADVVQSLCCILLDDGLAQQLTALQLLATVLAAACHDVAHPGLGNGYHKEAVTEQFKTYGAISTNEELHLDTALKVMDATGCLAGLTDKDATQVKALMRELILGTDMAAQTLTFVNEKGEVEAKKGKARSEFDAALIKHGPNFAAWPDNQKALFLGMVLHSADVSNCSKVWSVSAVWSVLVMLEFFGQGRKAMADGLSCLPMMDERNSSIPLHQGFFARQGAAALMHALAEMLPVTSARCITNIAANAAKWAQLEEAENQRGELLRRPSQPFKWLG